MTATCPTDSSAITRRSQGSEPGPRSSQEIQTTQEQGGRLIHLQQGSGRDWSPRADLKWTSGRVGGVGRDPRWGSPGPSRPLSAWGGPCFSQGRTKISFCCFIRMTLCYQSHILLSGVSQPKSGVNLLWLWHPWTAISLLCFTSLVLPLFHTPWRSQFFWKWSVPSVNCIRSLHRVPLARRVAVLPWRSEGRE